MSALCFSETLSYEKLICSFGFKPHFLCNFSFSYISPVILPCLFLQMKSPCSYLKPMPPFVHCIFIFPYAFWKTWFQQFSLLPLRIFFLFTWLFPLTETCFYLSHFLKKQYSLLTHFFSPASYSSNRYLLFARSLQKSWKRFSVFCS